MPRLLAPLLALSLLLLASGAQASYITRTLNKPVPGGVAVVDLGPATSAPSARFDGKPVLVVKEQDNWLAIVGIPLTQKPGTAVLNQDGRTLPFSVGSKKYPEQRITLKNTRQVNPNPADLKRIDRELAEQIKAYRSFSPALPSNLILDKPVNGPLSSKFGVRRFFNGEERNPHAGLDFAVPAGTPIKTPANGKVILVGITSSMAARCSLTMGRALSACSAICRRSMCRWGNHCAVARWSGAWGRPGGRPGRTCTGTSA